MSQQATAQHLVLFFDGHERTTQEQARIRNNPRLALVFLLSASILLALAHLATMAAESTIGSEQLRRVLNVNEETSIPTWFSTIQLFIAFLLVAATAWIVSARRDPQAPYWYGLAFLLLALSIDEAAGFHEAGSVLLGRLGTGGQWVVLGVIFSAIVGLAFLPFLRRLPARITMLFCIAAFITISGAVIVESIHIWEVDKALSIRGELLAGLEEFLERLGISVFIYAMLLYISEHLELRGIALARGDLLVEDVGEDQRRDNGGIGLDHETRRVHG